MQDGEAHFEPDKISQLQRPHRVRHAQLHDRVYFLHARHTFVKAIYSLFEGVAGVEEIDTIMKLGMAHPMGPLQLADFIGLDVCLSILQVLHEGFGNPKYAPCPLLVNMVQAGHKGIKSGQGFYSWSHGTKELIVAERFRKH